MRRQGTGVDDVNRRGVYGSPSRGIASSTSPGAVQVSPLIPGAEKLEGLAEASLQDLVMVGAPRHRGAPLCVALGLAALAIDAPFTILALKDRGGSRLGEELRAFGCTFEETGKRHHRICVGRRPAVPDGFGRGRRGRSAASRRGTRPMVPAGRVFLGSARSRYGLAPRSPPRTRRTRRRLRLRHRHPGESGLGVGQGQGHHPGRHRRPRGRGGAAQRRGSRAPRSAGRISRAAQQGWPTSISSS